MFVWGRCTSVQCVPSPLVTSSTDSTDSPQCDDAILSEIVSGELVILVSLWKNVSAKCLLSPQIIHVISCYSEGISAEELQATGGQSLKEWGLTHPQ